MHDLNRRVQVNLHLNTVVSIDRCSTESENRGGSMMIEEEFSTVYPIQNKNKIRLPVDNSFVPQILKFGGNIEKTFLSA